jgi:hypothetical protein
VFFIVYCFTYFVKLFTTSLSPFRINCDKQVFGVCIAFFSGHDESKGLSNQWNFLELLRFLAKHNEEIDKMVLENTPENHQMIVGVIQKDIANAAASKTLDAIFKDLGESSFAILVDESRDISVKEQLTIFCVM